jgi:hypothetical protein
MRRKEKCKYREGDWFAVPLRTNGYAVGIIARAAQQGGILLGYFFGPRRHDLPNLDDVRNCRSTDAILVARFGDLGLLNCAWSVLGHYQWNRSSWPMPVFARKDVVSGNVSLVEYDEDDPSRELRFKKPGHRNASQYPDDGLFGFGAVELRLTKLLEDSAPNR